MVKEIIMKKYFLAILFIAHWSCEESKDSNQQNDAIIGSWNFVSESEFRDYECSVPYDDWEFELPGISINGICNISENKIRNSINFEFNKEWMCGVFGGTLLDDGNSCESSYYFGYSINMDEFAEEICPDFSHHSSNGVWNATTGICSAERNEFATYTMNSDATLMYLIRGECDCVSDDCYSESEAECNSFAGEWVIENDTLEISMSNENLTLIDKDRWDGDFCDCDDSNDINCNSSLNRNECIDADGYYDEGGEDCRITVYTMN